MSVIFFLLTNLIIAVIIASRVFIFVTKRKHQIEYFSPGIIFSIFYFGYYVLGASISVILVYRGYFTESVVEYFPVVSLISLFGISSFYLGYGFPNIANRLHHSLFSEKFQDSYKVTILFFLFTWVIRYYLVSKGIIVSKLFIVSNNSGIDPNEFYLAQLSTIDRILWIVNPGLGIFSSLLAYKDAVQGQRGKVDKLLYTFIGLEILYQLFILNNRLPAFLLLIFIILFSVYYNRFRLIKVRYFFIALIVWIFIVYPLGQYMRTSAYDYLRYGFTIDNIFGNFLPDVVNSFFHSHNVSASYFKDDNYIYYRFAPNDFFGNILERIHSEGYSYMYGESYAVELPMLIPRILYPEKPKFDTQAEGAIQRHYNLPFVDTMTTPMTEAYANFGILGVMLTMFLYGYVSKKYWMYIYKRREDKMLFAIYVYFLYDFYSPEQSLIGGLLIGIRAFVSLLVVMLLFDKIYLSFSEKRTLYIEDKQVN